MADPVKFNEMSDSAESLANLAKDFPEGLTYPGLTQLMVLDNEELLDVNNLDEPQNPKKTKDKQKKDKKNIKIAATKDEVIKAGDGKTYPKKGDTVRWRMKGVFQINHFHDLHVDSLFENTYPLRTNPGIAGMKFPLPSDKHLLANMTAGEKTRFKIMWEQAKDNQKKQLMEVFDNDTLSTGLFLEVELLMVNSTTAEQPEPAVHLSQPLDDAEKLAVILKKQKVEMATLQRTIIKAGDGKTYVKAGDNVTVRVSGVAKRYMHGNTVKHSQIQTFQYPQLKESFKVFGGYDVKFSWDTKVLPNMTEGEKHKIAFDGFQLCMGSFLCSQIFNFDTFELELLKVN